MNKFRFFDWKVYKDSRELFSLILKIVKRLPKEYRFELGSQLIRSSLSINLNLAEGSGKSSDKELNRFIDIALGSLYETLASIDILRVNKFISDEDFKLFFQKIDTIANQLGGFKKRLTLSKKL